MEHDTGSGGRIDAKNSIILEELGFFDPVETMDDMFCNANLMKGLDFNTPDNNPQFDELFQGSGDGDSVDRSENSQDFAVGEMFDNISLLWSVDELLCGDDEELGASDGQQACFETEDRKFAHILSSDTNAGERIEGNTLLNCEKEDQDFFSQNEIIEGNSVESSDLNIEKKLESISLAGPVNDGELGFNEVMVKEATTVEGSCGSSDEKPTEVRVESEISSSKEIEEGEIVDYSQDGIAGRSEDEYDDEECVFRTIKGPIRSKNEVKVLPAVSPVNIILEEHHHTIPVGNIFSVIGQQIIVEGLENHCPLNESSVLWITNTRSVLGVVDEIFGPVKNPYYVVRYNSEDQVPSGVNVGDLVSYIPEFVNHILNENTLHQKGYDASGENDEEVSEEEFSDDAKEEEQRRRTRITKRAAGACIDNRNRRNGRPPRPRTFSIARIHRSHFIRNPKQSSPSFRPRSSNNGYPQPSSVATPSPSGSHGPVPVSRPFPLAQCQISPAQIPLNPPQEMPSPFFFQAQTQAPQATKVTHLQPSPSQVMACPFSQWDYTQVMTLPLLNPCPNQLPVSQAAQSQPQVLAPPFSPQPGQQHQNGMAPPLCQPIVMPPNQVVQSFPQMVHTQPTNLPFSQSPAPFHQMSSASAQMASIWGSTFQNFQPATVLGMAFPPANVDRSLLPNSQISQPALLNYHIANNTPPSMPPAQQRMHPSLPTMPTPQPSISPAQPYMSPAQPCMSLAHPYMSLSQPCISSAQPNMPPTQPNMPPTQPNMHSGQPTMPSAQPSMPSAQANLILAQPCMSPAQPCMSPAQPYMSPAQPYMSPAQPYMSPAQPCISPAQPNISPAQPYMSPAHPTMPCAQPSMILSQPSMILSQPNMILAQPSMILTQPRMHPAQPYMSPAQPCMFPAQPYMSPAQPNIYLAQPNMLPNQPTVPPSQPIMSPAQPSLILGQPRMHPAQPCMSPAQPCMSPAQPYMSTPQPNIPPVQPNIPPIQPSMPSGQPTMSPQRSMPSAHPRMHPAQPSMFPAHPNLHMVQPSMSPAHPNTHMATPRMHPVQPSMHPGQPAVNISQPSIHPAQPNMIQTQAPCLALPNMQNVQATQGQGMAFQTWQTATTASSPTPQNLQLVGAHIPPNGQQSVWPFPSNVPG